MLYTVFILTCTFILGLASNNDRQDKSFSLFTVLKWKNTGCQAVSDTALQGVCYTQQQCNDIGGSSDGNCAAGFGVCCIVVVKGTSASPGGAVTQNCSYIQNVDYPAAEMETTRMYMYTITKCSSDICQIRLDFLDGNFGQPTTLTGACVDTLTLSAGGGEGIPVLCGNLQGQHVYMDAGVASNAGTIDISTAMANTADGTKSWRIKVSQIECSSETRAPNGCLQYFFDSRSSVSSFNWDGREDRLLASQDYRSCIRQNEGMCSIQWTECPVTGTSNAFKLDAATDNSKSQHGVPECAGANANAGTQTDGMNYIQIPGTSISSAPTLDTFCGDFFSNFVGKTPAMAGVISGAVIATGVPFEIRTVSVGERGNTATDVEGGYCLDYTQVPCGINPTGHNTRAV